MFKIIWSHHAECDYIDILEYWINHNKSNKYSAKLINEVEKKKSLFLKIQTLVLYRKSKEYAMY
jgi:hypothetical protein